jgi:hypothetical protein
MSVVSVSRRGIGARCGEIWRVVGEEAIRLRVGHWDAQTALG